jgi:hypothetical protein
MSTIRVDNFGPSAGGTTYSARGIAKAWVNFNGTGTIAARDSENVSSLTDNGTGNYTVNFSNSFDATNFVTSGGAAQNTTDPYRYVGFFLHTSASFTKFVVLFDSTSTVDPEYCGIIAHGDLA